MPVSQSAPPQLRMYRSLVWTVAGLCACVAAGLFVFSALSFNSIRAITLSSIPPGYEDRFTPALFTRVIFGVRLLALMFCISAILIAKFARPLGIVVHRTALDLRDLGTTLRDAATSLTKNSRLHVISLIVVMVWAIVLRLAFFGEPIRNDEAYSFTHYASRPLYVCLTYYTVNNHFLNTLLMHISTSIFGASTWAVRLPTLIAGILIVPATYCAIRLFHGAAAALLAAALASASSPLIEYSFNARGYSLGTLFFLLMILMAGIAIRRRQAGAWIILSISGALAVYAVPTMVFGVAGVFLYILLADTNYRRNFLVMAATGVLTLALYAPALATVGLSAIRTNAGTAPLPRSLWLGAFTRELESLWRYWNFDLPVVASVVVAAGAILALVFRRTLRLPPVIILLGVILAACVLLSIQSQVPPRRSWLFVLPLYFGAAASGWAILLRKLPWATQIMTAAALVLAAWMGTTVLTAKSLRHSGLEAAGPRSVEPIALDMRPYLSRGAQFICYDYFDSGLDFEMRVHRIHYHPSPTGELLVVTPAGLSPQRTVQLAGLSSDDVLSLRKIAQYPDADVYLGERGPGLPFQPTGTTDMGVFTAK